MTRVQRMKAAQTIVLSVLLVGFVASLVMLSGCATTTPQIDPSIAEAREKARQDSLRRDEKLRMLSFANENKKSKQYRSAIKQYWRVLELDSVEREFKDVHRLLGECYFSLNMLDSAIVVYTMGTKEYPDYTHLYRMLGYLYRVTSEVDKSIENYRKVVELEPESLDDHRALADLYISINQNDRAIQELQKIVEQDPGDKKSQETLASLLRGAGDLAGYVKQLESSLEKDPENREYIYNLAKSYKDMNNNEKAAELYERLLALTPEDVMVMQLYGEVLQNLQRYRDALRVYEKATSIDPDNARILCEIAVCYKELKDFPTGRRYCRTAMQKDANYGYPHIVLGEIYETSIDECIRNRENKTVVFDDKLVYWFAYEEYRQAQNDIEWRDYSLRRLNYLQTQVPNDDDKFFHESEWNAKRTSLPCYEWIKGR